MVGKPTAISPDGDHCGRGPAPQRMQGATRPSTSSHPSARATEIGGAPTAAAPIKARQRQSPLPPPRRTDPVFRQQPQPRRRVRHLDEQAGSAASFDPAHGASRSPGCAFATPRATSTAWSSPPMERPPISPAAGREHKAWTFSPARPKSSARALQWWSRGLALGAGMEHTPVSLSCAAQSRRAKRLTLAMTAPTLPLGPLRGRGCVAGGQAEGAAFSAGWWTAKPISRRSSQRT